MAIDGAKRILIYGVTGSGKSTFARRLSDRANIPWTSVDDVAWLPGWRPMPDDEQIAFFENLCQTETWLLDSAYGKWLHVVLPRTELILGLDYPRWLSLSRLLRRTASRIVNGDPCCNQNRESLRMALSRESIILWHFRSWQRKRNRLHAWANDPSGPRVVLFKTPAEAEQFLKVLGR